jgi:hypothetical protein
MNYSRLALSAVGATVACFVEWTVVGIVIGLIYKPAGIR